MQIKSNNSSETKWWIEYLNIITILYNDVIVNLEGKIQIRISNKVILWLYSIINYLLFNNN